MDGNRKDPLREGTILEERYRIQKVLGSGGFGITYEGCDLRIGVKVAIKEYFNTQYVMRDCEKGPWIHLMKERDKAAFEKEKKKILREARIIGEFIDEPGVVDVTDCFEANETAYIVMNYLDGLTLKEYIERFGCFYMEDILEKMFPLIETLGKIHDRGIIHRDISPDNIMVTPDGSLKLLDFGAARNYESKNEKPFTVILKNGYAPPEQYSSDQAQGPWTDIYAICAVIYECITGKIPNNSQERLLYDELRKPSALGRQITEKQEAILLKGLCPRMEERYHSTEQLARAFRGTLKRASYPPEKMTKRAVVYGLLVGSLCIILIGGLLLLYYNRIFLKFWKIRTETIILTPDDTMTTKEYYQARRILEERIKILAGEGNYLFKEEDGQITVITPLEVYAEYDIANLLKYQIARPTELGLVESFGFFYNAYWIDKENIECVELKTGRIEGIDPEEYQLPAAEDYKYLTLTLTDQCSRELQEGLRKIGSEFEFVLGPRDDPFYSVDAVPAGDGRTFYLLDPNQEGNYIELLQYNLTHPVFDKAFTYQYEIPAEWENPDTASVRGRYQCSEGAIQGDTIIFRYSCRDPKINQAGIWYNFVENVKARLDTLKIPYAFGVSYSNEKDIVIKTRQADISIFIAETLPVNSGDISLEDDWTKIFSLSRAEEMNCERSEQGQYYFHIKASVYEMDQIKEVTETFIREGSKKLYLKIGDYRIAQCSLTSPILDGRFSFQELCFEEREQITEDTLFIFDYIETITKKTELPVSYSLRDFVVMADDKKPEIKPDLSGLKLHVSKDSRLHEIKEQVRVIAPDSGIAEQGMPGNLKLYIDLNLNVNEELPETAVSLVQKIYESCNLGEGDYESITFFLIDEEKNERARIFFTKNHERRRMDAGGVFIEGRLEPYQKTFKQLIRDSSFFGYEEKNWTWSFGEMVE